MDAIIKTGGPFVAMLYLLQCYKSLYNAPIFVRVAFLPLLGHNCKDVNLYALKSLYLCAGGTLCKQTAFFSFNWWLICLLFY